MRKGSCLHWDPRQIPSKHRRLRILCQYTCKLTEDPLQNIVHHLCSIICNSGNTPNNQTYIVELINQCKYENPLSLQWEGTFPIQCFVGTFLEFAFRRPRCAYEHSRRHPRVSKQAKRRDCLLRKTRGGWRVEETIDPSSASAWKMEMRELGHNLMHSWKSYYMWEIR